MEIVQIKQFVPWNNLLPGAYSMDYIYHCYHKNLQISRTFVQKTVARNWGCGLSVGTFSIFMSDLMPGYKALNVPPMFLLWCKNLWKNCVEWINSCQQIPEKDQSYVKVGRNNVHFIKVLKLWVILWSRRSRVRIPLKPWCFSGFFFPIA